MNMEKHRPELEQYWARGMQNCQDEEGRRLYMEAARDLNIPVRHIKTWIRNENGKIRRQAEREENPDMPAKKKNKITRRASNPWTCFLKRTLTGKSANPNAIQEASRQYKLLETEDPGLLAELKEEAKNNKKTTVEDLNQEEKELEAQRLYKELCKTVNKLHRCGWEGMGVFYSALSNNVTTCGTPKGESFLDDNPQMLLRFGSLASSGKYGERKKESVEDLRARVRDILNNKWYLATKEKHFSYKKFLEGKVEVEGLPDGVDLKTHATWVLQV
ncbi:hypothetical protein Bbelb_288400 [Branchiostoma belcheri]|nr:hypothetical protein Bbelb_288400 [Branchiostoma belcheri]